MKKNLSILAAFLMAAALLVSFASCEDGSGTTKPPKVTSVKIGDAEGDPLTGPIEGVIGKTIQFKAIVEVTNGAPKTVNWTVESDQDPVTGTSINSSGLLRINAGESEGTILTVTATSTRDASKSDSIQVELVKTTGVQTHSYSITYDIMDDYGNIDGPDSAEADEEITLTIYPEDGYELNQILVSTERGRDIQIDGSDDIWTFTMPAEDVIVFASFKEIGSESLFMVIVAGNGPHGTVTADPEEAEEGTPITLTIEPATDCELDEISATSGGDPFTLNGSGNTRTFNMPAANVTVTVSWISTIPPPPNTVATPTATPPAGTYATAQSVTLSTTTAEATIYYTIDGTAPTETSTLFVAGTPIAIAATTTLKAFAVKDGMDDSEVLTAVYTIDTTTPPGTVATPTATPPAGTYAGTQSVTLATTTAEATIYYTVDGTEPTAASTPFAAGTPISIAATTTLKAFAVKDEMEDSAVLTALYTITPAKVATPTATPPAGPYTGTQSVTLATTTAGATIYYTTDGTEPTIASTVFAAATPISIAATTTLKAFAVKDDMLNSDVLTAAYTITPAKVATPTATPGAGTYTEAQNVTLATTTAGATIYYTLDGTEPTIASTVFAAATPIAITDNITLKALAVKDDMLNSDVLTAAYTIDPFADLAKIDGFDYYTAQATQGAVNEYGVYITGGNWWYGLLLGFDGQGNAPNAYNCMQVGGDNGTQTITRNSNSTTFSKNITSIVTSHPTVSLKVYTRGAPAVTGGLDTIRFHLGTGANTSNTALATQWSAPAFNVVRYKPGGDGNADIDSLWIEMKIPLSSFKNAAGTQAITDLTEVVITGWRVEFPASVNSWIADIKLIEEVVQEGYQPQELYSVSKGTPAPANGDFTISASLALVGSTVTLTPQPDIFYELDQWTVTPNTVVPVKGAGSAWTFTMPNSNVTVNATFKAVEDTDTVNLASGRSDFAYASRVSQWHPNPIPQNAFDGNEATEWQGQPHGDVNREHWIGVDLGAAYDIGFVRILWGTGDDGLNPIANFYVQIADSMTTAPVGFTTNAANHTTENYTDVGWTNVGTFAATASLTRQTFALDTLTQGRFIRIKATTATAEWPRVKEFEVYKVLPE